MGGDKKPNVPQQVENQAEQQFQRTLVPSAAENELAGLSGGFMTNYNNAVQQQGGDYTNIMNSYNNLKSSMPGPTSFGYQKVNADRPSELGEAYGYLREAAPGYRDFANTGGYSNQDVQELRARGVSPIRTAYANTMQELNRARSLGGDSGAPNYIAAVSRANRELPQQMADATTTVNAGLADAIRQGKLAGLAGLSGIGSTMGGLSSDEAARMLSAAQSNQSADLQSQALSEESRQNSVRNQLGLLSGQTGLYGSTPGMASMFGNQALNAYGQRIGAENSRMSQGTSLLGSQLQAYGLDKQTEGTPWWKTALTVAATVAPYVAMAASSKELKTDIKKVSTKEESKFAKHLKDLPLYTWKYKGDDTTHFGPIAEEFKKNTGVGDGKTIHLADIMGIMLASAKEHANA